MATHSGGYFLFIWWAAVELARASYSALLSTPVSNCTLFALRAGRGYGCTYQTKPQGACSLKASAGIFAIGEIRRLGFAPTRVAIFYLFGEPRLNQSNFHLYDELYKVLYPIAVPFLLSSIQHPIHQYLSLELCLYIWYNRKGTAMGYNTLYNSS